MKILQVCPKYHPSFGGVEEHVKNLSERMACNHEVTVFTCDPTGQLLKSEEISGVKVYRFKSFSPSDSYHISLDMLRELKASDFDIVHGHSYHALPLFFCRYAKRGKFIATPYYHGHGSTRFRDFLVRLYRTGGQKIFEEADRIVLLSNHEKEILIEDFKIREDKITIIPSGIDLSEFKRLTEENDISNTILCVGRLEKYKGVQYIIQALPMLDSRLSLSIVGKGPFKPHLLSVVEKLGLEDRVSFHQDLPREELLNMYANADVFVSLSRYESFSIVVAEALASKTPCVLANASALGDWIDNINCLGIDYPIDINRLAELIDKARGIEVAQVSLWDWDDVVKGTLKVYQE
jgi:glycosyltransferase involved in cell wall biosynthesis